MASPADHLVLVTGISGFIGSHVAQQLLQAGYRVRGTVRSLANKKKVDGLRSICAEAADESKLELVEATLTEESVWDKVVEGCTMCCHVASPFPLAKPRDEQELIRPAVEGVRNVLKACAKHKVKRVAMTSSVVALTCGREDEFTHDFTEQDWGNEDKGPAYPKSKVLAEREAWRIQESLSPEERFELAMVLPGFVQGPILTAAAATASSQEPIIKMMRRDLPAVPEINFGEVDVRDVAKAHVVLMSKENIDGQRFILCEGSHWMGEMANALHQEFSPMGYRVPTGKMPKFLLHVVGLFDSSVRQIASSSGKKTSFINAKSREELGIEYRDVHQASVDAAYSLIQFGAIPKTSKFVERGAEATATA